MDMGLANELFNPSAKHTEDERQRLEHTRVIEGDHGAGRGPIDLESGIALMVGAGVPAVLPTRPRVEETDEDDQDDDPPEV